MLQLDLPGTQLDPGAEIEVILNWEFETAPSSIELRVVWNTDGKGDRDLKIVQTHSVDQPSERGQQPFTITLPWGPYSFSGKLISLTWAIECVAPPSNESTRVEFVMAPGGDEVLIGSVS